MGRSKPPVRPILGQVQSKPLKRSDCRKLKNVRVRVRYPVLLEPLNHCSIYPNCPSFPGEMASI